MPVAGEPEEDPSAEVASLRSALQQKEREVALLVGMLRKQGADPSAAVAAAAAAAGPGTSAPADDAAPLSVGNGPLLQLGAPAAVPLEDALLADKNRAVRAAVAIAQCTCSSTAAQNWVPCLLQCALHLASKLLHRAAHAHGLEQQQLCSLRLPHPTSSTLPTPAHPPHAAPQFEYFCASSPTHDAIQENKALLRGKYDDARGLGARVNASKQVGG